MLRESQFDSVLIPMIYHHFDLGARMVPVMRNQLFNVQSSTLSSEKGTGMGGIGPDAWDQYRLSGVKGRLSMDQLYTQTYTHEEYPVEIAVERKLLDDDQYGIIQSYIQRVGLSGETKMEIDAFSLLNNAFSSSYTWSDGKALCATDHPKTPNASSGTYSNKGTSALTEQSLSDTRVSMMRFKDDKGNELGLMPNELWVPVELQDTAIKITQSLLESGTANNATNPQNGRWTVKTSPRLTDTNNWFVVDGMWRQMVAKWYNRQAMELLRTRLTTTEVVYEAKLRYSFGVDDWRWIYGHEVA